MTEDLTLPPGWVKCWDETYKEYYYYNHITKNSQWERPVSIRQVGPRSIASSIHSSPVPVSRIGVNHNDEYLSRNSSSNLSPWSMKSDYKDSQMNSPHQNYELNRDSKGIYESPDRFDSFYDDDILSPQYSHRETDTESPHKYLDNDQVIHDVEDNIGEDDHYDYDHENEHDGLNIDPTMREAYDNKRDLKTNQDYVHLARMYKIQRPYQTNDADEVCVLCRKGRVQDVFFPCEHKCVCRQCIVSNDILEHTSSAQEMNPDSHFNCPLCANIIKRILPKEEGKEAQKYWDWCYEIKPPLPSNFEKRFEMTAKVLTKIYVNGNGDIEANTSSSSCLIS